MTKADFRPPNGYSSDANSGIMLFRLKYYLIEMA